MDIRAVLRDADFFTGLTEQAVANLAEICFGKRAKRGELLFLEGKRGSAMYVLTRGSVQLYRVTEDGREVVIKTILPVDTFAEAILFEEDDYPASAVATEDVELIVIPKVQIECLLEDPRFRDEFIAMLMKRLRYLVDRIVSLTAKDVEERFFDFLEERYGRKTEYRLTMSKKALAAAIGTIPETFSRLLSRLAGAGDIRWEGEVLTLRKGYWEAER